MCSGKVFSSTSVLLLFTMGCYIYVPPSAGSGSPVGETVRIDVTASEAVRLNLAEVLPESPTVVEGELLSNGDDTMEVMVRVDEPNNPAFRSQDMFQRLEVDRRGIVRVTQRELSRSRTFLILGTLTAIVLSSVWGGFTGFVGGSTIPPGPEKLRDHP